MVHTHWVVCGDGPVKERPGRSARRLCAKTFKDAFLPPAAQHLMLNADKVWSGVNRTEHATERATRVPAWQTERRLARG